MGDVTHHKQGAQSGGRWKERAPRHYLSAARKLRQFGATDADLAEAFNISLDTLSRWRAQDPDFARASRNIEQVLIEKALYMRAVGYNYVAEKVVRCDGNPTIMKYNVHVPPDEAACEFWLTNRRPDLWRYRKSMPCPCKKKNQAGGKTPEHPLADLYDRYAENPIPRPASFERKS